MLTVIVVGEQGPVRAGVWESTWPYSEEHGPELAHIWLRLRRQQAAEHGINRPSEFVKNLYP